MAAGRWPAPWRLLGRRTADSLLDLIERQNAALHAWVSSNRALAGAGRALRRTSRPAEHGDKNLPPLLGVPVALKDLVVTRGRPSTAGSRILEGYGQPTTPSSQSVCARRGAVLPGKTNMDEFAMGSSTENSAYGPDAQSLGPRARAGRLQRRLGRGRRRRTRRRCRSARTPAARSASPRRCAASSGSSRPTAASAATASIAFASSLDQIGPVRDATCATRRSCSA